MKPYYQDKYAKIYLGDCLEILPDMPKVDLVLTDPPWLAASSKHNPGNLGVGKSFIDKTGVSYGEIGKLDVSLVEKFVGIARRAVIFTGVKELALFNPKFVMFWHRPNPMPTPVLPFHQSVSPILLFGNWKGIHVGDQLVSIRKLNAGCIASRERILESKNGKGAHPCQMPMLLPSLFLSHVPGVVLDPFMGSGTTLVAAKQLNRKAIGIEIEEKYCEIAAQRLSQEVLELA